MKGSKGKKKCINEEDGRKDKKKKKKKKKTRDFVHLGLARRTFLPVAKPLYGTALALHTKECKLHTT
jgi:hypothetical protein